MPVLATTWRLVLTVLGTAVGTAWVLGTAAASAIESSCFGDQIVHPQAARIARNTVFIAEARTDGTLLSAATGFVVRGAHGIRIVTAQHVVDLSDRQPDSVQMVFLSDGVPLGIPRIVVATSEQKISISDIDLLVGDLAVLEITRFSNSAARDRLAALDGLSVRAGRAMLVGETTGPTGVIWGYSGSPAVDRNGQVVGVLTGANFRGHTTLKLGTIQEASLQSREVTLPNRSLVVVEPLHSPKILQELELSVVHDNDREESPAVFSGFPFASCASTSARLQRADSQGGVELLKKWDATNQVDAWWLPPPFSVEKLKLAPQ